MNAANVDELHPLAVISHTLMKTDDGSDLYYCMQCNVECQSVDDFVKFHQEMEEDFVEENLEDCIEESQWEVIDGKGFAQEDSSNAVAENVQQYYQEDTSDVKVEDDIGDNKYFCYDCRTVFRELKIAEEHDCPGIVKATLGEEDPRESAAESEQDELIEYMCAYCEQKFMNLSALEQHQVECNYSEMIVPEENVTFQCSTCEKVFGSIEALNHHNVSHKKQLVEETQNENVESFTCQLCNTEFTSCKSLKLHMRIHQERPLRRIQEALPKVAAQKYDKLKHFFCEICNKSFDQHLLGVHKDMHQNFEELICQICNRQFKNKQSFEVHQQLHSSENNNGNSKAVINTGPTDAAKRNAKNGVKSMHVANAKKTFPCQYCGHLFWRPHEKVRHEYVHTGEKPHKCEVCGKRFRVPYSLTLHLRTHTDIRPYVCAHCNKRFKSQSVYTHHLRTHFSERAYKCDICDKAFRTNVQLYSHKNCHTKPFNCTVCNRPFASLFAVNAHMKSHAKSKNCESLKYVCDVCGAGYGANRALRAHKKDMHNIESNELLESNFESRNDDDETTLTEDDENYEANTAAMMLIKAEDTIR